jgi:hypothetical protein
MTAALRHLMKLDGARPFVLAYLEAGDITPLLVMCDWLEENESAEFLPLARAVRAGFLTPNRET